MQIKINFNKLFQLQSEESITPSTTSLQNSYHLDEPSLISQVESNNINLFYKLNDGLFFDSSIQEQTQDQINILNQLSSIGRSHQNSLEKQQIYKQKSPQFYKQKKKTPYGFNHQQRSQIIYLNDKGLKPPGQRLYYESKINQQRKQRDIQRLKNEIDETKVKQLTFKPALNQNSKKILQLAESPIRKMNNLKKTNKRKQQSRDIKSYAQRMEQEQLQNCTFRPVTNNLQDPIRSKLMFAQSRSEHSQIFDQLYNQHRLKEMRRQMALQEEENKHQKKMTKEQLQQFFLRNQKYLKKREHKQELMRTVSSQYDLTSGRKLFQPKVKQSPFSPTILQKSRQSTKSIGTPSQKNNSQWSEDSSPAINNKKQQTASNNQKPHPQNTTEQRKFSSGINSKQAIPKTSQANKKSSKNILPYQISRLSTSQQKNYVNKPTEFGNYFAESRNSKNIAVSQELNGVKQLQSGYKRPVSNLFNKLKSVQSEASQSLGGFKIELSEDVIPHTLGHSSDQYMSNIKLTPSEKSSNSDEDEDQQQYGLGQIQQKQNDQQREQCQSQEQLQKGNQVSQSNSQQVQQQQSYQKQDQDEQAQSFVSQVSSENDNKSIQRSNDMVNDEIHLNNYSQQGNNDAHQDNLDDKHNSDAHQAQLFDPSINQVERNTSKEPQHEYLYSFQHIKNAVSYEEEDRNSPSNFIPLSREQHQTNFNQSETQIAQVNSRNIQTNQQDDQAFNRSEEVWNQNNTSQVKPLPQQLLEANSQNETIEPIYTTEQYELENKRKYQQQQLPPNSESVSYAQSKPHNEPSQKKENEDMLSFEDYFMQQNRVTQQVQTNQSLGVVQSLIVEQSPNFEQEMFLPLSRLSQRQQKKKPVNIASLIRANRKKGK